MLAVAKRMKALRIAKGYNQVQICADLDLATNTWNQWEKGERAPNLLLAMHICDQYGITLDYIYRGRMEALPEGLAGKIRRALEDLSATDSEVSRLRIDHPREAPKQGRSVGRAAK